MTGLGNYKKYNIESSVMLSSHQILCSLYNNRGAPQVTLTKDFCDLLCQF